MKALRAVHSRFFLSVTILNIALVGPGLVGSTLLQQVHDQKHKLQKRYNMDIRVLAIVDSKKMLLSDTGALTGVQRPLCSAAVESAARMLLQMDPGPGRRVGSG